MKGQEPDPQSLTIDVWPTPKSALGLGVQVNLLLLSREQRNILLVPHMYEGAVDIESAL